MTKISIIIATRNCRDLLKITLNSIRMGGWEEIEIIVMDGLSTDGTPDVVKEFPDLPIALTCEPDGGQYDAINKGMARAAGDVLCWINAGDYFLPGALRNAAAVFNSHPDARWITGRRCVGEGLALRRCGNKEVLVSNLEISYGLCCESGNQNGFLQQEGMFWRRDLWEQAGPLDTTYKLAADFDLWIRFARVSGLDRLIVPLAAFSFHETNRSIVQRDNYIAEVEDVISRLSRHEKRARKWIGMVSPAAQVFCKIPVLNKLTRAVIRQFDSLTLHVIVWRKTKNEGFVMVRQRRCCWIQ